MFSPILVLALIILSSLVLGSINKNTLNESLDESSGVNPIYAKIKGSTSGSVTGDVEVNGHVGEILVLGYSHAIVTNTDPNTGLPTGKNKHYPFKITIEQGKASPILLKMLNTGETVLSAEFNFFKVNPTGTLANNYRITLESGRITQYSNFGNSNGNFETFSFTYQKITWYDIEAGIMSQIDLSRDV